MNLSYFNIPYFVGFVKRFLFITVFSVGGYGNVHVPTFSGERMLGRECIRHRLPLT